VEFDVVVSGKSMFTIMLATYKSSRNIDFAHGKPMLQRVALEDLVTQCYETSRLVNQTLHNPCCYVSQALFLTTFPLLAILYETMHMNDTIGTMIDAKQKCENNP